ncbi:MAG: MFS transporter [Caldilineaceae bacterium]|nr:MFS transporter [Caldilineaceae bacterium]
MNNSLRLRRIDLIVVALAYLIFVLLGMPDSMLGIAWPDMQAVFGVTKGEMGSLLLPSSAAFILVSLTVGQLISRFGIAKLLIAGCLIRGVGLLGYALAPKWGELIVMVVFFGMGSGLIDAGLNTHFAVNYNERLMNWLHASFGLGATIGPLLMTTVLNLDASWRIGYGIVALVQMGLALGIVLTRKGWRIEPNEVAVEADGRPVRAAPTGETLRQVSVWLGILTFFIYAGTEVSAGLWSYSIFTEARGIDAVTAGRWVAIYWGSFTIGRLVFGFIAQRWPTTAMLRVIIGSGILSALLFWWNPQPWIGFIGLTIFGFTMAPVFPLLTSATEKRLPRRFALNAIGYQVGAASLGVAVIPSVAGILAERLGLEIIGPYLVVATIILFLLHEALVQRTDWRG